EWARIGGRVDTISPMERPARTVGRRRRRACGRTETSPRQRAARHRAYRGSAQAPRHGPPDVRRDRGGCGVAARRATARCSRGPGVRTEADVRDEILAAAIGVDLAQLRQKLAKQLVDDTGGVDLDRLRREIHERIMAGLAKRKIPELWKHVRQVLRDFEDNRL